MELCFRIEGALLSITGEWCVGSFEYVNYWKYSIIEIYLIPNEEVTR